MMSISFLRMDILCRTLICTLPHCHLLFSATQMIIKWSGFEQLRCQNQWYVHHLVDVAFDGDNNSAPPLYFLVRKWKLLLLWKIFHVRILAVAQNFIYTLSLNTEHNTNETKRKNVESLLHCCVIVYSDFWMSTGQKLKQNNYTEQCRVTWGLLFCHLFYSR